MATDTSQGAARIELFCIRLTVVWFYQHANTMLPGRTDGGRSMSYVNSYELLGPVAQSVFGSVWRGRDHAFGRDVALKQPDNVLLDLAGTSELIGFGLARLAGAAGGARTPGDLSLEAALNDLSWRPQMSTSPPPCWRRDCGVARCWTDRPATRCSQPSSSRASRICAASATQPALPCGGRWRPRRSTGQRMPTGSAALDDAATRSFGTDWPANAGAAGIVVSTASSGGRAPTGPAGDAASGCLLATSAAGHGSQHRAGHVSAAWHV